MIIENKMINQKEIKNTKELLTQFSATSPTSGGASNPRKKIHYSLDLVQNVLDE